MDLTSLQLERTWQYVAYILISLAGLIFIVILLPSSGMYFRRFLGELNPLFVFVLASLVGAAALWLLQARHNFVLFMGKGTIPGLKLSAALATLLAIAIVAADFFIRYPEDTNVPVPQALLFYPSIGFVVEIIFHLLPLALLLIILNPFASWIGKERIVWLGFIVVAVLEPTFQVFFIALPLQLLLAFAALMLSFAGGLFVFFTFLDAEYSALTLGG